MSNPLLLVDAMHIRCGATTPEPTIQALLDAKTLIHDVTTGENHNAGCGKLILWWEAYRCVDCDKFMHRECIQEHFKRTKTKT